MFINIIYPFFGFLLIFFGLRYQKIFQLDGLSKWDLSIGFLIKSLVSLLFIYIFGYHYGEGNVYFDSYQYHVDGKILNDVFYKSPLDYFKLLTGIGDNMEISEKYLHYTGKWFYSNTYFLDDAKNVTRLSSLIHFISLDSMIIQFFIFNLLSIIGVLYCYRAIIKFSKLNGLIVYYGILLFPSLLFWGSALLKEPVLLLGIGGFIYSSVNFNLKNIKNSMTLIFSVLILISFKPYVFFTIILVLILFIFHKYLKIKLLFSFLVFCILSLLLVYSSPVLRDKIINPISFKQHDFINLGIGGVFCIDSATRIEYNISEKDYDKIEILGDKIEIIGDKILIKQKVTIKEINRYKRNFLSSTVDQNSKLNLIGLVRLDKSNSYIPVTPIKTSLNQMILNIPEALINSLLRPWPGDPGKKFKYFAMVETFLIFAFLIMAIIRCRNLSVMEKNIVFSFMIFALIISLIIGWTTPILGAIVRYRIPVYLAILLISFIIIEPPAKWKKENIS